MYTQENRIGKNKRLNSFQLSKLHTFEVAARHNSFSLAAEELSLTPSAVSQRINKLEEDLGLQLFVRSHRKVDLTEEGIRIYRSLQRTLNTLNQDIQDVKNGEISGELTIYSRPSFAQCWLVPRIFLFQQQYPSIELKILTGNENINLQGYGIDMAIYFDAKYSDSLWQQEIMSESIIPVCSPSYAKALELENNPENLKRATLLHDNQAWDFDSDDDEWSLWAQKNNLSLKENSSSIGFDRSDLAVLAAIHNAGVALGRRRLVEQWLRTGELVTPLANTAVECKQRYYIATLQQKHTKKVDLFIDWLTNQAERELAEQV